MRLACARAHAPIPNPGGRLGVFARGVNAGGDEVTLIRGGRGLSLRVEGEGARGVPTRPRRNTVGVALARLLSDHPSRTGLRARILKGRGSGGLGSSAASAAAAVVAALE